MSLGKFMSVQEINLLLKALNECCENCRFLPAAGYTIGQLGYVLDSRSKPGKKSRLTRLFLKVIHRCSRICRRVVIRAKGVEVEGSNNDIAKMTPSHRLLISQG